MSAAPKPTRTRPSGVPGRLAIDGNAPVRRTPWPPWPVYAADEVRAASRVLESGEVNYWTGSRVKSFERAFARHLGVEHAVAVTNGTIALELCLRGLGVGEGDDVLVPARTYVATASAVATVGARPIFADVDETSGNVTPETVERALTPGTRAVIVVHLGGWPCEVARISEFCRAKGLLLIEDCAQAHGASRDGVPIGATGDAAAFSFCQDKILSTGGEGGMIATRRSDVWRRVWSLKENGKSWDLVHAPRTGHGFRWVHQCVGTNARMTEFQASIGEVQLAKLDAWVAARKRNAARLRVGLADFGALRVPAPPVGVSPSYYRLYAYVEPARLRVGWNRDRIMTAVAAEGIPCGVGSCGEVYLEQAFRDLCPGQARLPVARRVADASLALTVHPTIQPADIDGVIQAFAKVLSIASS